MLKQGEARDKLSALKVMLDATKNLVALLGLQSLREERANNDYTEKTKELVNKLEQLAQLP